MVFTFETENLLKQQLHEVELWHGFLPEADFSAVENFPRLVSIQHQVNFELWHQEDLARDPDVSDSKISDAKTFANCVLSTPVCPRNINDPIGLFGEFNPALFL